jgi:hypothetical protein
MIERGDLCGFCMRPECPGQCLQRARSLARAELDELLVAQTRQEATAAESAPAMMALCGFCFNGGGYRVPCHGCGVVGPVMK